MDISTIIAYIWWALTSVISISLLVGFIVYCVLIIERTVCFYNEPSRPLIITDNTSSNTYGTFGSDQK